MIEEEARKHFGINFAPDTSLGSRKALGSNVVSSTV